MRCITVCSECGGKNIEYLGQDICFCKDCQKETNSTDKYIESP